MLYKTHQRYGLLSGLLGIPLLVTIGLIPIITMSMRFSDAVLVVLMLIFSMLGALFGSEFPDCDSYGGQMENGKIKKGSIPSQKHPTISKIFRTFGVKHRGKFSHDYASLALFFGSIWLIQRFGLSFMQNNLVSTHSKSIALFFQIIAIFLIYWLSREIAIKYKFSKKGKKNKNPLMYYAILFSIFIIVYLTTTFFGFTSFNFFSAFSALKTATFVRTILNILVIFIWIGAYSHLFADMMTNEGVNIFGKRLAPAKMVLKIKKFPFVPILLFGCIGYYLSQINGLIAGSVIGAVMYFAVIKTDLKTGSAYEDMCYLIVSILCIPAVILAFISVTGGDVQGFLNTLGLIK